MRSVAEWQAHAAGDRWPRARALLGSARLRDRPEDFVVDEIALPVAQDGRGRYLHLRVAKYNLTTNWVAAGLARHFGVASSKVSYAGLKDRRALATQWFCVPLAGAAPLPPFFEPGTCVRDVRRAAKPIARGELAGNVFELRLRTAVDRERVDAELARFAADPVVPNYFGPQRFGNDGANVAASFDWARGARTPRDAFERGLWLSAARALLFDAALAARVASGAWRDAVAGDARLAGVPAGPMWGRGRALVAGEALAQAQAAWRGLDPLRALLEREGVRQGVRAYGLRAEAFGSRWDGDVLVLSFRLPAGAYATSVVRELFAAEAHALADEAGE